MPPIKLDYSLRAETLAEGVTQSELSLLDECAMKWNLRYNNLLTLADSFYWPLWIGTTWHQFQEDWRNSKGDCDITKCNPPEIPKNIPRTSEFEAELEYWLKVIPAYQETYAALYREEAKHPWRFVERELEAEHLGIRVRGMVDLVCDKPRFIRDFKSSASAWFIAPDGWHFKLQFMTYCWLMWKNDPKWVEAGPFDFQLDIMQKPALRQTQKESWAGHITRVCADVKSRPDFYLKRIPQKIEVGMIHRFEENVLTPKIQRICLVRDNPEETLSIITNPNTNSCNLYNSKCEFFENCSQGWQVAQHFFTKRTAKHEEL